MGTQKSKTAEPVFYILTDPKGKPLMNTVSATRDGCWERGFWAVVDAFGLKWCNTYWKRWDASISAAKRAGYVIRKARLVLAPIRPVRRGRKTAARKRSA